jgi:thiol-disulfide isomerase/thioredoxin
MPDWYEVSEGLQVGSNPGAKVMLVNWWASWCGPCREEAPDLSAIAEDYADDVVVVGVNAGGEDLMSDARAFVREMSIRFPIIRADRAMKDAWGVGGFPESFIVGTDGRISAHINGPIDDDDVRAKLDAELDR